MPDTNTLDDMLDAYRPAPPAAPNPLMDALVAAMAKDDEDADEDMGHPAAVPVVLTAAAQPCPDTMPAASTVPDGREAAAFLARWVQQWRAEWFLNLVAIPAAGGSPVGKSWPAGDVLARQPDIAAWIADHNARGMGVYFTPNPVLHAVNGKPEKADIAAPLVLSVDLDPPDDGRPYDERRKVVLNAAEALARDANTDAPALIVDSGNGSAAFFGVPDGTPTGGAEAACKALTHTLAERFGLKKDGTHNVDRLMRLPVTLNWPSQKKLAKGYPAAPNRARVLHENPGAVLSAERVAELARQGAALGPRAKTARPASGDTTREGDSAAQDSAAVLAAAWPDIAALGSLDDLPADLRARLEGAVLDRDGFGKRWAGIVEGITDPSGSGLLMALVGCAKAAGFDLLDTARIAWVWKDTEGARHLHGQPDPVRAIARCWDNSIASPDAVPDAVAAITAEGWFVVQIGASVLIGRHEADGGLTLLSRQAFLTLMENRRVKTPKGSKPAAGAWLEHGQRPTYTGAGLYPPGAVCPEGHLNLWPGWGIEPRGGRMDCRRILRHLLDVVCLGDKAAWKWLLRWMAWGVQNAAEKQDVAVVLAGGQGTGKGAVAAILRRIYGRASLSVASKDHLTGRFNGHLADKMFVHADEALFARDPSIVGPLKALVTERTMPIERKGVDVVQAPNRFRLLMTTNEAHAVHLDADDRRFAVLQTAGKRSAGYFDALWKEINSDGTAAFFALLKGMTLKGWDMRALPNTRARAEQKIASLTGVARWLDVVLRQAGAGNGGLGGPADWFGGVPVSKDAIRHDYEEAARRAGERHILPPVLFWKEVRHMIGATDGPRARQKGGGGQQRTVVLPALDEARARYAASLGITGNMEWDE